MIKLGMVRETTGKQRHRLFTYHRYLEILNRGPELQKAVERFGRGGGSMRF